ncbi:hypothetical protein D3C85_1380620 [compost metagenome]
MQVVGFGVHVTALGRVLGDAVAIAVVLVVALDQVRRNIPVQGILPAGRTLEPLVGEALGIEIVTAAQAQFAAEGKVLALVALGDDVDDAAGSAGPVDAARTGHHFNALDTGR